ncbi:hypothetical protein KF840_10115 [bacterium]|nr:hypothetical protein [bacterium]
MAGIHRVDAQGIARRAACATNVASARSARDATPQSVACGGARRRDAVRRAMAARARRHIAAAPCMYDARQDEITCKLYLVSEDNL